MRTFFNGFLGRLSAWLWIARRGTSKMRAAATQNVVLINWKFLEVYFGKSEWPAARLTLDYIFCAFQVFSHSPTHIRRRELARWLEERNMTFLNWIMLLDNSGADVFKGRLGGITFGCALACRHFTENLIACIRWGRIWFFNYFLGWWTSGKMIPQRHQVDDNSRASSNSKNISVFSKSPNS